MKTRSMLNVLGTVLFLTSCTSGSGKKKDAPIHEVTDKELKASSKIAQMEVIKAQFHMNAALFSKNLMDITEEEAHKRIEGANSLLWIVGHSVNIYYNIANHIGLKIDNPYKEQFGYGKFFNPDMEYPKLSKMIADWEALTPKISAKLSLLTAKELKAEPPFQIPLTEQSISGLLAFQMHHLGYEYGQIGLYRKFLGKSSFTY
ncbi:MAG: DinB family protein [Bacteroidota bacterium]